MPTPYTRLTTSALSSLASTELGALLPYQIRQVQEYLDRVNWGRANSNAGEGSDSNVANQPTINQILTLLNGQNV
jgi:hypothetical protein